MEPDDLNDDGMDNVDEAQRHADSMIHAAIESLMKEHEIDVFTAIKHVTLSCEKYVEGL